MLSSLAWMLRYALRMTPALRRRFLPLVVLIAWLVSPPMPRAYAGDREPPVKPKLEHRGLVIDATAGIGGCTRQTCAGASGHGARPGLFASGFIGDNIAGRVELGVAGGWGRLRTRARAGRSPVEYWSGSTSALRDRLAMTEGLVDGSRVQRWLDAQTRAVKLMTYYAAPVLRIHFVPKGRVLAFAGAGAGYGALRGDYWTSQGRLRMMAHGLSVPLQAGFGVALSNHVAVIARFDYVWIRYFAISSAGGDDKLVCNRLRLFGRGQERWGGRVGIQERAQEREDVATLCA